jgi:predicted amidohydrolase YtcJ
MDQKLPRAQLVAIQNGKIVAISSNRNLSEFKKKNTNVINYKVKSILPGFINAHFHFLPF